MATRLLLPRTQRVLLDGRPASGAKLYTYVTGTSTPKATYSDAALTVPNANPVVADASGVFGDIFPEGGTYRLRLEDADGNLLFSADDVDGAASTGGDGTTSSPLRNRILNGAMQISQENGTSNVDVTTGAAYVLDGWSAYLSTTPGGTLRLAQNATVTPAGSPTRLRATVQASDGTISAGDYYTVSQRIEGWRVSDARFGSASARQLLLRFGVRSSIAGTFCVALRNGAFNRSYVTTYNISAGEIDTDVVREITIPGDEAGTWLTDTGIGFDVTWTLAAGTTFQGVTGWQAGDFIATSSQTNFMGTGSATFDLFDVGLYVDASAAGTFPTYEIQDIADQIQLAQRYYETGLFHISGYVDTGVVLSMRQSFKTTKREAATVSASATSSTNLSGVSVSGSPSESDFYVVGTGAALGAASYNGFYKADARL